MYVYLLIQILMYLDVVNILAFSKDGEYVASGSWDGSINLLNIKDKKLFHKFEKYNSRKLLCILTKLLKKVILVFVFLLMENI